MHHNNLSIIVPGVHLESLPDGTTPTVSSLDVARHFQKKHKHVLDEIRRIQSICPKSFLGPNFRPMSIDVEIGNGAVRKDPAYRLTRDGFFLLAMGFTGKAAIQWKIRYIEAFNALERAALKQVLAAARQDALAEAARVHARITPERMRRVRKSVYYKGKNLSEWEIAKLLDCNRRSVTNYLRDARALGLN